MEERLIANGYSEMSGTVRHAVTGSADFDFSVVAEIEVSGPAGTRFVVCLHSPTGERGYLLLENSFFDESGNTLEEYDSIEDAEKSAFFPFYEEADHRCDTTLDTLFSQLDDTRNYPSGRACAINFATFFEFYSEHNDVYYQITESSEQLGQYTYSASLESYYLSKYMGPFYAMYFGEEKEEEYLFQVSDLEELPWDSPYRYELAQYRGAREIQLRHSPWNESRYPDEENVAYEARWIPLSLLTEHRMRDNGMGYYTIVSICFVNDRNEQQNVYTASYGSDVIEYVLCSEDLYDHNANRDGDIVYINRDLAFASEWGEYFELLDSLRDKRRNGITISNWHTGATDSLGILQCSMKPVPKDRYYLWREQIDQDTAQRLRDNPCEIQGEHLRLAMFLDTPSQVQKLFDWAGTINATIVRSDSRTDIIYGQEDSFWHMYITDKCDPGRG